MKPIEIPAFGAPLGNLVQPLTPAQPVPPSPAVPVGVAKMVADNPLIAGGLILGGAYLAYKAGSLLGGLLAGGAALVYGPTVLDALTMPVVAQPQPAAGTVGPVIGSEHKTDAEYKTECAASGGVWNFAPVSCDCFGCDCPQGYCSHSTTPQQPTPTAQTCRESGGFWMTGIDVCMPAGYR